MKGGHDTAMKHPITLAFASVLLVACNSNTNPSQGDSSASSSTMGGGGTMTVSWKFEETRRAEYDQPFSQVTLVLAGDVDQDVDVGEWSGTCAAQQEAELMKEGSDVISGIRCWWAGAGEDFLVRRKSAGELRIEHRSVDEGSEDEPAPVFPYKLVESVKIPENIRIR